jgi:hypothetical protein
MEDREPQVSAEQLAALRRLRVVFGPVEVVEVVADDANSGEEPADNTQGESEEHHDRPAQDDAQGARGGGRAALPGSDDASADGCQ